MVLHNNEDYATCEASDIGRWKAVLSSQQDQLFFVAKHFFVRNKENNSLAQNKCVLVCVSFEPSPERRPEFFGKETPTI